MKKTLKHQKHTKVNLPKTQTHSKKKIIHKNNNHLIIGGLFVLLIVILGILIFKSPDIKSSILGISSGTTYYVSTTGNDSFDGKTSINSGNNQGPWATIQKAANSANPGDTIIVIAGTYYTNLISDNQVQITRSGSVGEPIIFKAQGTVKTTGFYINADYITIKGFDIATLKDATAGIKVDRGGYCDIEDNYIHASTNGGIVLNGTPSEPSRTHDCTIKNNKLNRNGSYGMEIKGANHLIEGNEVWSTIQHHPCNIKYANETWLDADGIHFHGSGHIFRKNYIHTISYGPNGWTQGTACSLVNVENLNNDYNDNPHIDCFQTLSASDKLPGSNIIFEQNFCDNLEVYPAKGLGGKGFQDEGGSSNLTIRNNVIKAHGLGRFTNSSNLKIINNTLIGHSGDGGGVGFYLYTSPNAVIQNNIFAYQENGIGSIWPDSSSKTTLTAGNNCVYRAGGNPSRVADPGDVWNQNPLFVNGTISDYHLQPMSPCIDHGINFNSLVINDYDGFLRPQNLGYDMGAFEYRGSQSNPISTPNPTPTPTVRPVVTPTPTPIPTPVPTPNPTPTPTVRPVVTPTPTVIPMPTPIPTPINTVKDTTPPSVKISYPSNGMVMSAFSLFTIKATATDNVKVVKVKFKINGVTRCTDYSAPYTCPWYSFKKRYTTYKIEAIAYDAAGNMSVNTVRISISR